MNNKGFISISVVYSFFVVFLLMLLFIIDNLVNDRLLLDNLKETIKSELKAEILEETEEELTRNLMVTIPKNFSEYLHDRNLIKEANDNLDQIN